MTMTRLFPTGTDTSGSDWTALGVSPAHIGLSDGSDSTGVQRQLSSFETSRVVKGVSFTQLPAKTGRVKNVYLGSRAGVDLANSAAMQVLITLGGGATLSLNPDNLSNGGTGPTDYLTASFGPRTFAQLNGITAWNMTALFISHDGVAVSAYELFLDVEWYRGSGALFGIVD